MNADYAMHADGQYAARREAADFFNLTADTDFERWQLLEPQPEPEAES